MSMANIYSALNDKYNKEYELFLVYGVLLFCLCNIYYLDDIDISKNMIRYITDYNYGERMLIYSLLYVVYGSIEMGKRTRYEHRYDRIYSKDK